MMIRHTLTLTILAALMPLATTVKANTVTLYQAAYYSGGGGEFTAVTSPSFLANGYVPATEVNTSGGLGFETFCLETGVHFTPGTLYDYTVGTKTQPNTGGGAGSGLDLTIGAAFLYYQFATGQLLGYNYANTGSGPSRTTDANLLQAAIWYLQGNQTYAGFTVPTAANNSFYALALANQTDTSYLSAVNVLQLWVRPGDTVAAQNQLVLTGTKPTPNPSVPDCGMTVFLLGGALLGLQAMRRRLAA